MKKSYIALLFLISIIPVALGDVKIEGYVNDQAGILNDKGRIEDVLISIHDSGEAEFVIAIVESIGEESAFDYSYDLAESSGIGDKEKDNGLLLLIVMDSHDYQFQTGRGLEAKLNAAKLGRIGREYIVPYFKEENYDDGLYLTAGKVYEELTGEEFPDERVKDEGYTDYQSDSEYQSFEEMPVGFKVGIFLFFLFVIFIRIRTPFITRRRRYHYYSAGRELGRILNNSRGRGGFGGLGGGSFGGSGAGGKW